MDSVTTLELSRPTVTDDGRAFELLRREREGLTFSTASEMEKQYGFSGAEMATLLGIDLRTYQRYKKEGTRLRSIRATALLDPLQVLRYGEVVFGSTDKLRRWLRRENAALDGNRPIDLLHLSTGRHLVNDTLTRIEFGVFG